jgi:glycerophosphoryl diester phosphodiesterase
MPARPQIIGHRGGKGFAPENTRAAFRACLDHGGDACELDVRLTRDDALVVMHDATVDRTTNGTGRIADLTLAELAALSVQGEPIPSLREVFETVSGRGGLQLHVKPHEEPERNDLLLRMLAEMVAEHRFEDRCTVLATEPETLAILQHNPKVRLDIEIERAPAAEAVARLGRDFLLQGGHRLKTSDFDLASEELVRGTHAEGLALVCWASDSSDENVERLLRLGVDAVMTDYPERMGALIDRAASTRREARGSEGPP